MTAKLFGGTSPVAAIHSEKAPRGRAYAVLVWTKKGAAGDVQDTSPLRVQI
jgi:hypothetical protein